MNSDVFLRASWSHFLPLIEKRQKISCGTREVKAESECGLYLACSISWILENVTQCCYTLLFCFGNVKFTAAGRWWGRVPAHPPVKRGFQLRMEILRLRENCLQEPFFSDRTDMWPYLLARQGENNVKVSVWMCVCVYTVTVCGWCWTGRIRGLQIVSGLSNMCDLLHLLTYSQSTLQVNQIQFWWMRKKIPFLSKNSFIYSSSTI